MDLEGYEVFIDPMVLNGVLAGVVLGLTALWLLVLRSALWRAWLQEEHGPALDHAAARLGLVPRPRPLRALLALEQDTAEGRVRVALTASFGQPRAVLQTPLRGRVALSPEPGDTWLADQIEAVLGPPGVPQA